jgi:hypothetical protein
MTPGSGILSTDWVPGPSDGTRSQVVVSFTDFHSDSEEEWQQIAALGIKLAESWPIMRGAVGLWLWGKHADPPQAWLRAEANIRMPRDM